jgi:hypothetical protein
MTTTEHSTAEVRAGRPVVITDSGPTAETSGPGPGRSPRMAPLVAAAAGYLLVSVVVWWGVWSTHPTSTTTCGCGDSSLFTWFLAWPAYALAHGLNPLYSTALFHPTGVNLLSNTASVGIGVVLAPVTWLFGPVATLNVALLLAPALSALAMFILLRRWTSWAPAAFTGGLLYGFSPFILISLTDAHLMLAMAPIPPLIVACLDEALVRQRRSGLATGVVLGVLIGVQFFVGSEVLALTVIIAGIGVGLLVAYGLWHRGALRRRVRHAAVALLSAGVTAAVLLAYPVWFALAGPAHLAGPIWGPHSDISYGGTNLRDYALPSAPSSLVLSLAHRFGGYQAPTLSGQYFGLGLLVVLVIGLVVWRRDPRLWLFAALGLISVPLSSGLHTHGWSVWRLFVGLPLMDDVIPSRFLLITYLAAAVMLGLIVDHTFAAVNRWSAAARGHSGGGPLGRRVAGGVAAMVVAAVALVPIAWYYSSEIPLTTQPVVLPTWFHTVAPDLSQKQVVLAFPVPFLLIQSAMTWQAVDGMSFAMVGGGGPDALPQRAGPERVGQSYIGNLSISGGPQTVTPEEITAVRQALDGWGVTTVVVPDLSRLPSYDRVHLVRTVAVVMTAATGEQPIRQGDAWVWTDVGHAPPPVLSATDALAACNAGSPDGTVASIRHSTACVLAGSPAGSSEASS